MIIYQNRAALFSFFYQYLPSFWHSLSSITIIFRIRILKISRPFSLSDYLHFGAGVTFISMVKVREIEARALQSAGWSNDLTELTL